MHQQWRADTAWSKFSRDRRVSITDSANLNLPLHRVRRWSSMHPKAIPIFIGNAKVTTCGNTPMLTLKYQLLLRLCCLINNEVPPRGYYGMMAHSCVYGQSWEINAWLGLGITHCPWSLARGSAISSKTCGSKRQRYQLLQAAKDTVCWSA